jgi:hypothetical protein
VVVVVVVALFLQMLPLCQGTGLTLTLHSPLPAAA